MLHEVFEFEGELIDPSRHPLETGLPPAWASGWGQDRAGVFTELTVREVTQKLRWIPPGKFLMGSDQKEPGRFQSEGPQHERVIPDGFWLFDTPVTQALWQAVMTKNPSRFEGKDRPVENVSWTDAREFVSNMKSHLPGIDLKLPSEAVWEYACRAGTRESTYAGQLTINDETADRSVLDKIAWFRQNSDGETHSVALKERNAFGLYGMLGNVWEWCEDYWHDSYEGAPKDGAAWLEQASSESVGEPYRVFRGGSWYSEARLVRSAYRTGLVPSIRNDFLGFRCAARSG